MEHPYSKRNPEEQSSFLSVDPITRRTLAMMKSRGDDEHMSTRTPESTVDDDSYRLLPEQFLGSMYVYHATGDKQMDFTVIATAADTSLFVLDHQAAQRFSAQLNKGETFSFHGNGGRSYLIANHPITVIVHTSKTCDLDKGSVDCTRRAIIRSRQLKPIKIHTRSCLESFTCFTKKSATQW